MSRYHAVVWLDHQEARIFHFDVDAVDKWTVHSDNAHKKLHHKAGAVGSGHAALDLHYLQEITEHLEGANEILIVGPGQAKQELTHYVEKHNPRLFQRIVGVESSDHPTDGQLLAHARKYFKAADQMLPQR